MEEQIIQTEYSEVMQKSYIDYAMSVIVARALPDARDGLKPVQRRTLYDMHELGIRYDRPFRKCARIVGDTMGKYHPHGDSSIYEALVVMAQEFKKGMPLVDGHGNFGSIEGDGAAAMRYTEARLQKITQEAYLNDLDKEVIDFIPNFDGSEKEPEVLPVRVPNLLVNGADGIAVGMTTSIPPHNFSEVIAGVKAYMDNPDISVEELMTYIKGPDFPTGGIIVNQKDLLSIYETGTGKIKIRGKVSIEKIKGGKEQIVISEIPYTMIGANIGKFLNDIYNLVETKKTNDIVDISNQSSKDGIRIVLELRKQADAQNLINMLYKKTKLEDTFGVNMLAVADGRPEVMGLKKVLEYYVDFQYQLTGRKYRNLLKKELDKKEIQEGLIKACDVIDVIIEMLRGSQNMKQAKECLMTGNTTNIKFRTKASEKIASHFAFSERQAGAILEMRLYKLIGLEMQALEEEYNATLVNIAKYEEILNNHKVMTKVIEKELTRFAKEYGRPRRTQLDNAEEVVFEEKKLEEIDVVCLMDRFGYIKTVDASVYERNKEAADAEHKHVIFAKNTGKIGLFTNSGKLHIVKVLDLPYGKFRDKGVPIDNVSNYNSSEESMVYIDNMEHILKSRLLFATRTSMMKLVDGGEFEASKKTIVSTKLQPEDEVLLVQTIESSQQLVIRTQQGVFLRFSTEEIPEKKKSAIGVRGMKLGEGDFVEEYFLVAHGKEQCITYKNKEIILNKLKPGKRDGKGVKIRV